MMDSAHIQARDAEYLRKQAKKKAKIFHGSLCTMKVM